MSATYDTTPLAMALFKLARTEAPAQFTSIALQKLGEQLPFHSALLSQSAVSEGARTPHFMHAVNLPGSFKERYLAAIGNDLLLQAAHAQPGTPVALQDLPPLAQWPNSFALQVLKHFDIVHALGTGFNGGDELRVLILHRKGDHPAFSAQERELKRQITPVLFEALNHNRLLWLCSQSDAIGAQNRRSGALCEDSGLLINAGQPFIQALRDSYCGWRGPRLPFLPRRCNSPLGHGGREPAIRFRSMPLHKGVWLVEAVHIGVLGQLTNRQLEIAQLAVKGHTDKELARLLELSPSTINNHLNAMFSRLQLSSRLQLAEIWNRSALAQAPGYVRASASES